MGRIAETRLAAKAMTQQVWQGRGVFKQRRARPPVGWLIVRAIMQDGFEAVLL